MTNRLARLILILVLPTLSYAATQATILRYRFNTGPNGAPVATAVDSGPFGFNGTVTGDLTYSSDVALGGKPFSLNATADADYIVLPQTAANAPYLNQAKNFTLSAFAMPTGGTSTDATGDIIASKIFSNGAGACLVTYALGYASSTQKFIGGVCGPNETPEFVTSADTFPTGFWYKLALKYKTSLDGKTTTISLVVNGKVEGKLVLKNFAGPITGPSGFQVGAANFEYNDRGQFRRNFVGFIDEVKLTGQLP